MRRRRSRRRALVAVCVLFVLFLAGTVYGLNRGAVRVSEVQVSGTAADISNYAWAQMQGKYLGLVPRDSVIFVPERQIRSAILADHPEFAAVSISHKGLNAISIRVLERTAVAKWCGVSSGAQAVSSEEKCYVFDPNGFIFAVASSTIATLNSFSVYSRLIDDSAQPLKATLASADVFPATFDFARQISAISPVEKIVIRDGEVDDYLASGTQISYVLGEEQGAYTALISAGDSADLADGSLEYVDLRFAGKVYLKKK